MTVFENNLEMVPVGKSPESTNLQLIGFFVPKKPIICKFVDISLLCGLGVDMTGRYFDL